ncbi:uncharacterized protein FTJAE_13065 [Fusarium tjaetaba]|uniref:Uncharacterized protein n=1 Tax=Fusarium tjaetaba TaxID=1567544 RepID=A0A8H5QIX5_9HYPO|nr:uncharacterized protein FTJAE_13065 [Fusarium tjaetaba]KAF5616122.1 hypothetical protein FTJAE_13065 [Fusarium tjaetaba]
MCLAKLTERTWNSIPGGANDGLKEGETRLEIVENERGRFVKWTTGPVLFPAEYFADKMNTDVDHFPIPLSPDLCITVLDSDFYAHIIYHIKQTQHLSRSESEFSDSDSDPCCSQEAFVRWMEVRKAEIGDPASVEQIWTTWKMVRDMLSRVRGAVSIQEDNDLSVAEGVEQLNSHSNRQNFSHPHDGRRREAESGRFATPKQPIPSPSEPGSTASISTLKWLIRMAMMLQLTDLRNPSVINHVGSLAILPSQNTDEAHGYMVIRGDLLI